MGIVNNCISFLLNFRSNVAFAFLQNKKTRACFERCLGHRWGIDRLVRDGRDLSGTGLPKANAPPVSLHRDCNRKGVIFLCGLGGGGVAICHSATDRE